MLPFPIPITISGDRIVEIIGKWLTNRRERRQEEPANILYCAGLLVHLARKLDGDFTNIMGKLYLLTADSTQQTRDAFREELNRYVHKTEIIDKMDYMLADLRTYLQMNIDDEVKDSINKIIEYGMIIRGQAGNSKITPFANPGELLGLLDQVKEANSPDAMINLRQEAENRQNIFDNRIIKSMIVELAILTKYIRSKYPQLPYPEWITSIIT